MTRIGRLRWMTWLALASVCVMAGVAAPAADGAGNAEAAYKALLDEHDREGLTEDERIRAIVALYDARIRPALDDPERVEVDAWAWHARAAHLLAFYVQAPAYLRDARLAMTALDEAGVATVEHREMFYGVLVAYREFEAAREYLATHPGLDVEPMPAVAGASSDGQAGPVIYRVDPEAFRLVAEPVHPGDGMRLVVVSHPLCGFSRRAMTFIAEDPALAAAADGHVLWLAPVQMHLDVDALQAWNREHPLTPVVMPGAKADWPMLRGWTLPTFHLLQDGAVVDSFSGWPLDDRNGARLVAMMARAGLL